MHVIVHRLIYIYIFTYTKTVSLQSIHIISYIHVSKLNCGEKQKKLPKLNSVLKQMTFMGTEL